MDREIVEYGVEDKKLSNCYIEDGYDIYGHIVEHKEELKKFAKMPTLYTKIIIDPGTESLVTKVTFYENGLVVNVDNTIPCDANRYDDFCSANMFIFKNGEVHYIFHKVDSRINNGDSSVNELELQELYEKMGKKLEITRPHKKTLFNGGQVKRQQEQINECVAMIDELVTPIEKQKNK